VRAVVALLGPTIVALACSAPPARVVDGSTSDAASNDAAAVDASIDTPVDASVIDATTVDAGPPDAGVADASGPDALPQVNPLGIALVDVTASVGDIPGGQQMMDPYGIGTGVAIGDLNGDGKLDAGELRRARRLRGADADGDGEVTLQEYQDFLAAQATKAAARKQTAQDFKAADANNDHKLDSSEWPANASASFADVDANGDGQVTGREVGAYMRANNGQSPF